MLHWYPFCIFQEVSYSLQLHDEKMLVVKAIPVQPRNKVASSKARERDQDSLLPDNTAATDIGVCKQDEPPTLTYHPFLCFVCVVMVLVGLSAVHRSEKKKKKVR